MTAPTVSAIYVCRYDALSGCLIFICNGHLYSEFYSGCSRVNEGVSRICVWSSQIFAKRIKRIRVLDPFPPRKLNRRQNIMQLYAYCNAEIKFNVSQPQKKIIYYTAAWIKKNLILSAVVTEKKAITPFSVSLSRACYTLCVSRAEKARVFISAAFGLSRIYRYSPAICSYKYVYIFQL